MKVYNHALLLPPDLYSGVDKVTVLNNKGFGFKNYRFISIYMENNRNGKLASKDLDPEVNEAMYDLGDGVIFAAKNYGFAEMSAICSKPSFESKARCRVVGTRDYKPYRFITIEKLLDVLSKKGTKLRDNEEQAYKIERIIDLLMMYVKNDDLNVQNYIYLPVFAPSQTPNTWEHLVMMTPGKISSANCFISDAGVKLIHPKEIIHFSNRKVLDNKSFFTLRALLESPETQSMALKLIDNCNISKSLVQVALLINHLPIKSSSQKKSALPNASMWFPITGRLTLDEIVEAINSEDSGQRQLTNNELEFIADNYYISSQQQSSHFEFKLKPKKK